MLINVNYLGNCTNNKKSSPDLQDLLQFPLQTLFRCPSSYGRAACIFSGTLSGDFLFRISLESDKNCRRHSQKYIYSDSEGQLSLSHFWPSSSSPDKTFGRWYAVTDGRTNGRCFHVRLCSFCSSRTPKTKAGYLKFWCRGKERSSDRIGVGLGGTVQLTGATVSAVWTTEQSVRKRK